MACYHAAGPTISLNLQTLRGVVRGLKRLEDRVDQPDVQGRQAVEKSNGENLRREKWLLSQIKTLEHQHALGDAEYSTGSDRRRRS